MIAFPEPKMVKTNGIDMAVYEAGPKDGLPVVLCHGFPELAYSWRYQIPRACRSRLSRHRARSARLWRHVAAAEKSQAYDMPHLTGDLAGLLDALGH